MTPLRRLSEAEFKGCFAEPMSNVTATASAVVDIWPYVDAIELDQLGIPSVNDVHYVYRDALKRYEQVVIGTGRFNTLLVVVIDLGARSVFGHFVLDLNGTSDGHMKPAG